MLGWFPRFQVATACFSCRPPDLTLVVTNFIFCTHVKQLPPGNNTIAVHYYYYYYYYNRVIKLTTSPDSPTTIIFILGICFPAVSVRTSMHTIYQWIRKSVEGSGRDLTCSIIVTYTAGLRKPPKNVVLLGAAISTQDLINLKQKSTHWEVTFSQTANLHPNCTLENKTLDVIKMHWNVSGYSEYLTKHSYEGTWYMWVSCAIRRLHQDYTWCQCARSWTILWNAISENEPRVTESCTARAAVRALAPITGRGIPRDSITGAHL